jgi:hypothetical protein
LPGAVVTAVHASSDTNVERTTDAEGRFFLPALRVGRWDISLRLAGFAPQVQQGILLEAGRSLNLDFTLGVQSLSEEVVVQAALPMLQTTTAEISDVIENREVVQLPLNGRAFLSLAQLSDAVVLPPGGTRGEALQQAGPLPNVGGQRSGHNIYLLDGTKITDELFNNLVISPSVDSIEEFKIQKSMYAAEFGVEPRVGRGTGPGDQPVQRAARSPAHGVRPAVRALQHVRRRRAPALRHERSSGDARAGLRAIAEDDDAKPRHGPQPRLWTVGAERGPCGVDVGLRRPN